MIKKRKFTEKGYMPWRVDEVVNIARSADQLARRLGMRFTIEPDKLGALGLTNAQIEAVKLQLADTRLQPVSDQEE